jgi:hypothetical protein
MKSFVLAMHLYPQGVERRQTQISMGSSYLLKNAYTWGMMEIKKDVTVCINILYTLLPQGKMVRAARCEYVIDVHTSKASTYSKRLKLVLLHLWRINVKTTGGFINIPVEDFYMVAP